MKDPSISKSGSLENRSHGYLGKLSRSAKCPRSTVFPSSGETSGEESDTNDGSYSESGTSDESSESDVGCGSPATSLTLFGTTAGTPACILPKANIRMKSKGTKSYVCTYQGCTNAYYKPSRLDEHKRSHTGERPFVCSTCQKAYLRESHLRAHARTHLPASARPFVCTQSTPNPKGVINAELISTQPGAIELPGPSTPASRNCGQRFWTAQHLRAHEQAVHLGENPHKCTSCSAAFAKHRLLRAHVAESHAPPGTKPYQCEHSGCSASFPTNQKLKTHSRVHDSTRYACAHHDCSNSSQNQVQFATWSALQAHMRSEHPPKCPYESCNGRTFAASRGLKSHLKVHDDREKEEARLRSPRDTCHQAPIPKRELGQDPELPEPLPKRRRGGEVARDWPCPRDGCIKAFKSKKAQADHLRVSHEGARNFPCPSTGCIRSFGYKHVMQRHVERSHREDTPASVPIPSPSSAPTQTTTELLTGQQRSAKNRPRLIVCPWPDAFGGSANANQTSMRCSFRFGRAYDLRRHLSSAHGLKIAVDEANAWVSSV